MGYRKGQVRIRRPYDKWMDLLVDEPLVVINERVGGMYYAKRAKNDLKDNIGVKSIWWDKWVLGRTNGKPKKVDELKNYAWYVFE